ncbi:MAG: hypothetical protein A2Y38_07710 [Spirochaetes bacterium GWB1_59_5]|nr:MAG: hypothetical protein A2Y38_07710 [Spirochaetes bacterium GWB1_59_5]
MSLPLECVVPDCHVVTNPNELMCARHWSLVPTALQRDVVRFDEARVNGVSGATLRWTLAALAARRVVVFAESCIGEESHAAAK